FDDVFFGGSEAEFQKAFEGNTENHSVLDCPNIHYNSKMPILYTVSFDSAVVPMPSYRVLEGSSIIEPAYPFDPEGKFYYKGCFEDPGYTKEFDFANTKITKDTVIYVKWGEREQVNVTFMKPKDVTAAKPEFETYETIKIWEGQTVSMPDIPAVKAEPGRYEVTGWYHDPDYKDFFYYDTIVYRDTFIYSQWEDVTLQGHCELSSTDGSLVLRYDYTDHVDFDGRKHVWKSGNAKESAKVAKDIRVENLAISYNGVALPIGADGISIKNVVVKRNLNANTDEYGFDDDEEESGNANDTLIVLKLNYNKKNATLKEMFGANKKLKKEINKLCNPKYKKKKYREDGETWYEYEPQFSGETATVAIYPIDISGNSVIYTKAEVASNPALSEKSGILIYSGKTKTTWKTVKEEGESDRYSTKFDIKGLTAQIFVDVNGVPTKKLIKLKAGGWKRKKHVYREDGETDIEYEDIITPKRFDYYIPMGGIKSGDTKVSSVYLCGNFSGILSDVARSESDYSKDKK
ncbi:MAG: hypothetical protein IKR68_06705, partial [Lachnospiraceae bacterium]|nr:hypothetical protein [Lachnospiraceae bacterium]